MIVGTGIDILEIARIQKITGDAFCKKMFTNHEMDYLAVKNAESIAGYFCAKEAVAKALGTGFAGFQFKDIEILKNEGCPYVVLHGRASEIAKEKGIEKIYVSISHSKIHATALAIAVNDKMDKSEYVNINMDHTNVKMEYPLNIIKKRKNESYKGDYGRVYIVGGSHEMSGAVILCSKAAFRSGAGLVICVVADSLIGRISANVIEATYMSCEETDGFLKISSSKVDEIIKKCSVVAIGIGLGANPYFKEILSDILKKSTKPVVIDADGLNILSEMKEDLKKARGKIVITPHLGEMSRLTGKSIEMIKEDRIAVAVEFSKEYNVIVLLKGNKTIVTDGYRIYENTTGNPGMAVGGSGDVLTGTIAALIGQNYDPFDATVLGAFIHGAAGDLAYEKYGYGLIAGDIVENLGFFLRR